MAIAINIVNPINAQLPEEASLQAQPSRRPPGHPSPLPRSMAIGVTIWHIPLTLMPQFGSSLIETLATIAVTFWYAWLFNHASAGCSR